jgi:hypothetical protein
LPDGTILRLCGSWPVYIDLSNASFPPPSKPTSEEGHEEPRQKINKCASDGEETPKIIAQPVPRTIWAKKIMLNRRFRHRPLFAAHQAGMLITHIRHRQHSNSLHGAHRGIMHLRAGVFQPSGYFLGASLRIPEEEPNVPLMARFGHGWSTAQCLLPGEERKSDFEAGRSVGDPERGYRDVRFSAASASRQLSAAGQRSRNPLTAL